MTHTHAAKYNMRTLWGILALIVVVFTLIYVQKFSKPVPKSALDLRQGTHIAQGIPLDPFTLEDMHQRAFTQNTLTGKWHLAFFGYSHCPEFCPTTLALINQVAQKFPKSMPVQFLFFSFDEQRDTPLRLQQFLSDPVFKDAEFLGIRGPRSELQKITKQVGLFIEETQSISDAHIEHSGTLVLINPKGKVEAIFNPPHDLDAIVHDMGSLMAFTNIG